jgi:DNA-binding LacI/PurR family transcriptional regulator
MPFVVLHRKLEGVEAEVVRGDGRAGACALTRHLIDAGWRRIAYVGGSFALLLSRERLAGYEEALAAAGIAVDPALVRVGDYSQQSGYRMARELLRLATRPEALLIANSRLALGALRALTEAGLRLPEDIAVAAFYDIAALDDYSPLMTTAKQPAYEIGQHGVRRLLERVGGRQTPAEDIILPNQITVRRMRAYSAVAPA